MPAQSQYQEQRKWGQGLLLLYCQIEQRYIHSKLAVKR